jgi:hypothetical protein
MTSQGHQGQCGGQEDGGKRCGFHVIFQFKEGLN